MQKLLFSLFLFLFITACKKQETEPPVVSLASPVADDTLLLTDSIPIQCTITDKNLRVYKIIIYNYYTRKLFYKEEGTTTSETFTIDKKVTFDLNADTTAYINILGVDRNGNTGGSGHKFYIRK